MAIAIDQANAGTAANGAAGTSLGVSTTATVAASGFIVASVMWWHATATLSSVSGGGLSWNIAIQGKHSSQNPAAAIAYAQAPSGLASGTTLTANYSASVNDRQIGITSFTGVATSSPVDTTAGPVSNNTTGWTTGNVTIAAGSVLIGFSHLDSASTDTITSPSIEALDWAGSGSAGTTGYRIESSAGSYAIAGTWGSAASTVTFAAAFLASAGGGGTVTVKQLAALGVG